MVVSNVLHLINAMPREQFTEAFGPLFEHSPWIAEAASDLRPFENLNAVFPAFCDVVRKAGSEKQLALIRAHPDLVGRATLTTESREEQAAAGLAGLSEDEVTRFESYNRQYREQFGFPFVICARLNKKEAILEAFPRRLEHNEREERETALDEIFKIAQLRFDDLIPRL